MKICENGIFRELTPQEITAMNDNEANAERQYWLNTPYNVAVNTEIRKKYDASDEFAILRQKDEKPEEYTEYFAYCEECKAYVKSKQKEVSA